MATLKYGCLPLRRTTCVIAVGAWLLSVTATPGRAGRLIEPTLTQRLGRADLAVIVRPLEGSDDELQAAETIVAIEEIVREPPEPSARVTPGLQVVIDKSYPYDADARYLLLGKDGIWSNRLTEVDDELIAYIKAAPPPADAATQRAGYFLRIGFFLKHLESSHAVIAAEAFDELDRLPIQDVLKLHRRFPRQKLRQAVFAGASDPLRNQLYGVMLGLCGDDADATRMRQMIVADTREFRPGMYGVMAGYLWLTGESGLEVIEQSKFVASADEKKPLGEIISALAAVRLVERHGNGRIATERLCVTVRMALLYPELADIAIWDLARWRDWSVLEQVYGMYGQSEFDSSVNKTAIVCYLQFCLEDARENEGAVTPDCIRRAEQALAELRKQDPAIVDRALRYYSKFR